MKYKLHPDWGLDPFTESIIEVVEAAAEKAAAEGKTKKVKDYEKAIELIVQTTKFKYDKEWWG